MPQWKRRKSDRMLHDPEHDTYKSKRKLPEPTVCPDCGAVFRAGRWAWGDKPLEAHRSLCPACHRIRDHYPAGHVTLRGSFVREHRGEVLGLVRNVEARERASHPLKRIIGIAGSEESADDMVITTTDIHLARSIGDELYAAYSGRMDYYYVDDANHVRVRWER